MQLQVWTYFLNHPSDGFVDITFTIGLVDSASCPAMRWYNLRFKWFAQNEPIATLRYSLGAKSLVQCSEHRSLSYCGRSSFLSIHSNLKTELGACATYGFSGTTSFIFWPLILDRSSRNLFKEFCSEGDCPKPPVKRTFVTWQSSFSARSSWFSSTSFAPFTAGSKNCLIW